MTAALPFYFAWVDEIEDFGVEHCRFDEEILSVTFSHDEGDFATLTLEIINPRVGMLSNGRKRWCYFAWTPTLSPGDEVDLDNVQVIFKGRIVGVPEDLENNIVKVEFIARPSDFEAQKEALAATMRALPYWDPIWFSPDTVDDPDNVLESRSALWYIDPVTHVVSVSDLNVGDSTIVFDEDQIFDGSLSLTYGGQPTRRVDVTATVSWDQIASGSIPVIYRPSVDSFMAPIPITFETYTGKGVVDNWPKPGQNIGGGWQVAPGSFAVRTDGSGNDVWAYDDKQILDFSFASKGKAVVVPPWAFRQVVLATLFPAHMLVVRKWQMQGFLAVQYDVSRGRSETMSFSIEAGVQDLLTDDTAGAPVELSFSSSEISQPIDIDPVTSQINSPLGKPWARGYLNTDRGQQSIEYLIMVARAKLLASARCVDLKCEVSFADGMAAGVSLRKSCVLHDLELPGEVAGGKIKSFEFTADGDTGALNCSITLAATVGSGGSIAAVDGDAEYVDDDYVGADYQRFDNTYVLPAPGDIAYTPINGVPVTDDGFDFDIIGRGGQSIFVPGGEPTVTNLAGTQEALIVSKDTPSDVYANLNTAPTTFRFQLRPVNNGPFQSDFEVLTTSLAVPKTIDLEAGGVTRVSAHMDMGLAFNTVLMRTLMIAVAFQVGTAEQAAIQLTADLANTNMGVGAAMSADVYAAIMNYVASDHFDEGLLMEAVVKAGNPPGLEATNVPFGMAMQAAVQVIKAVAVSPQMGIQMAVALQKTLGVQAAMTLGATETVALTKARNLTATNHALGLTMGVSAVSHVVPVPPVSLALTGAQNFAQNNNNGGTSIGVPYTMGAANGIIVAIFQMEGTSNHTVTSVTDSHGLTWHRRSQFLDAHGGIFFTTEVWWAFSAVQQNGTITGNFSGNPQFGANVTQFAVIGVLDTTNPWDVNASLPKQNGGGNGSTLVAAQSTTFSVSGARTLIFAAEMDGQGNVAPSVGSGWTLMASQGSGTKAECCIEYRFSSAAGSFNATFTNNQYTFSVVADAIVGNP